MALIRLPITGNPSWPSVEDFAAPDLTTGLLASYTQGSIAADVSTEADAWPSALAGGSPLVAASGTQKPSVSIDGYAQKVLSFAGTDRMTLAGIALPTAFTLAVKADFGYGGTDGWPVSLEGTSTRIALYDTANTLTGYTHVSGGTSSASSTLSSADPAGLLWLVIVGTWGGSLTVYRGGVAGSTVTAPAYPGGDTFTLHVGARSTNASPKPGSYTDVRLYNRALPARDLAALVAS